MAFDNHLNTSMHCGDYDYIGKMCLGQRMEVYLRLFENNGGSLWHVLNQRNHWQDLGNTKSNIC